MSSEITRKIIINSFEYASSFEGGGMLIGEREHILNEKEAKIISSLMGDLINQVNGTVFKIGEVNHDSKEIENALFKAFIYCFDKTIEIVYAIRTGIDNGFEWDSEDMLNGISGDKIPEYLQLKIMPVIPVLSKIYNETLSFSNPFIEEYGPRIIYDAILFSAVQLATEFGLRLDLEDTSEWDRYMDI